MDDGVRRLADLLQASRSTLVLTGAGMSTESGIPDFRSGNTGIYARFNQDIFSSQQFRRDPGLFWDFMREWLCELERCRPNPAHEALAWLEAAGLVSCLVTQNIDGLHGEAGSRRVLEIHGHLREALCQSCGAAWGQEWVRRRLYEEGERVPTCPACGGVLKPKVVFFGDALPPELGEALEAAAAADLVLVLGSSLVVHPAASIPMYCRGKLAIVNLGPTPLDERAELVLSGKLGAVLGALRAELAGRGLAARPAPPAAGEQKA